MPNRVEDVGGITFPEEHRPYVELHVRRAAREQGELLWL